MSRTERRLAAILAADVVGYSRLVAADEAGTLAALRDYRAAFWEPESAAHGGRIVSTAGDGILVEFQSAVAAVECALAVQDGVTAHNADLAEDRRVTLRIGINLGEVAVEGDDILGDGVNVAARLEALAAAGGICVSDDVARQLRGKLDVDFRDGGAVALKNIAQPVQTWHWAGAATTEAAPPALALPDKPSIAVLPFENMSGDPEQEYFADGIAEDVITTLSRFRSLFVIARNSSFTYKGHAVDVTRIGRELGVRYVVEGSVRKAGNRVRITAQLIDAASGKHLWADRFDGVLEDVFELQDRITERIVIAIEPEIEARERDRATRKPPENMDAWETFQRGLSHVYSFTKADYDEAVRLLCLATTQDPSFAQAHANLANVFWSTIVMGFASDIGETAATARAIAERAASLDPEDPMAHFVLGRLHVLDGEIEMALGAMRTAIELNPNFSRGHFGLGFALQYGAGEPGEALPHFDTALRLNPRDPLRWVVLMLKASALRTLGEADAALDCARAACRVPNVGAIPRMHLAACLAEAGQRAEAGDTMEAARRLQPRLSLDFVRETFVGMHETTRESLVASLRKAGLPETAAEPIVS